ncbi:hypothetical protein HGG76_07705 [Ochrobactrum tritici]|uniref:Uncharacterized protein n=1 Tax=Brucella tritici TaxID=94626 RepID=A0A7X6FPJ9_9HYPH|nr:hypothetical protein [Brucella tritici]
MKYQSVKDIARNSLVLAVTLGRPYMPTSLTQAMLSSHQQEALMIAL